MAGGISIESVFSPATVDFEEMKLECKKKVYKKIEYLGQDLRRAARRGIRAGKKEQIKQQMKLFTPEGDEIDKTPSAFAKGKQIVARGPGAVAEAKNTDKYSWNKSSAPGQRPFSQRKDGWLKSSSAILYEVNPPDVTIYVNPKFGINPDMFEEGGTYSWEKKIPVGYTLETISVGTEVERGDGQTVRHKNDRYGRRMREGTKNRSGRTQESHIRTWSKPQIVLTKRYATRGAKNQKMAARQFLAPAVAAFVEKHFNETFDNLLEK